MKNQTYRMTMLFDFYGELLTPRQKEFFDLYYNEDLSRQRLRKMPVSPVRACGMSLFEPRPPCRR